MKGLLPLLATLALAACATPSPEARVRSSLIEAGLSPPVAGCMAERLVDRLSYPQLKRLNSLAKLPDRDIRGMTVGDLVRRLGALEDPEIVAVVTRAGVGCAIAG